MKKLPLWFYFGLFLMLLSWAISWLKIEPISYFTFFPLWFGFILLLDGINTRNTEKSLIFDNKLTLIFILVLSALFWWYFELIVGATKNWYYVTSYYFPIELRQILASLFFSTLIIAFFEVATLIKTLKIFGSKINLIKLPKSISYLFFVTGIISIPLTLVRPDLMFPFLWITLFLLLDPINYWFGRDSLINDLTKGSWTRLIYLSLAMLICGLFWEMWNYYADPKWFYDVPYLGFLKVFEMPILGFLGYLPFAFELFAVYSFIQGIFGFPKDKYFLFDIHKDRPKVPAILSILIISFAALLFNTLSIVQLRNNETKVFTQKEITIQRFPKNIDFNKIIKGEIVYCGYALEYFKCLYTSDRNLYELLDSKFQYLNVSLGIVYIEGETRSNIVGIDSIVVKNIYKAD